MIFMAIPFMIFCSAPFWRTRFRWRGVLVSTIAGFAITWIAVTGIAGITDVLWDQILSYSAFPILVICAYLWLWMLVMIDAKKKIGVFDLLKKFFRRRGK